ncbi:MAG: M42 family metallopeptidase [Planctomycetota bacterium]
MAGRRVKSGSRIDSASLLADLSNAFGVAGFEEEVREVIRGYVTPMADEVAVDALGNLIATKRGKSDFTLMLDAHMDEIGLMVSFIDKEGYLRFTSLGGWDPRVLPSHAVTIQTRSGRKVRGVMGTAPPHVQKGGDTDKAYKMEELFIDIGAASREDVEKMGVRVGDPAAPCYAFERLYGDCVMGKAFDDRTGCAVMVKVLDTVRKDKLDLTLVCNFAVCEEMGMRGAKTAAFRIKPDMALAFEGTTACDMPGVSEERQVARQGKGPAITVADRSIIVKREMVKTLEDLAAKNKIPVQHKAPIFGATDAGEIQLSREGVLAGVLSVPCRYIHSCHSTLRLSDFDYTVDLAAAFVRECRRRLFG